MPSPPAIEPDLEQYVPDPTLAEMDFPLRRTLYPLGFEMELATTSQDVIDTAVESWGSYEKVFDEPPIRVQIGVAPGNSELPPRSQYRSRGHLMSLIANLDNFVVSDFNSGSAFGWISESIARDHPVLRYRFLLPSVLMLLQQRSLAPMHSALISHNGCGVVLFGESMAGKTSLAYAAARAGWTFITDDGTYLLRKGEERYAIGEHHSIRFRDNARILFPELAAWESRIRPNGKFGFELMTRDLPIVTALGCKIDHLVYLNRNEPGPCRMRPYPMKRLREEFDKCVCYGTPEVRTAQWRCFDRLAGAGLWELCYQDFESAILRLEQLVDSGKPKEE